MRNGQKRSFSLGQQPTLERGRRLLCADCSAGRGARRRADAATAAAGLPAIDVSPAQGKLLHLLARLARARNILEIGTLGGYSTIWLARALPADGRIVTLGILASRPRGGRALENILAGGAGDKTRRAPRPGAGGLAAARKGRPRFSISSSSTPTKPTIPSYLQWALRLPPGSGR